MSTTLKPLLHRRQIRPDNLLYAVQRLARGGGPPEGLTTVYTAL